VPAQEVVKVSTERNPRIRKGLDPKTGYVNLRITMIERTSQKIDSAVGLRAAMNLHSHKLLTNCVVVKADLDQFKVFDNMSGSYEYAFADVECCSAVVIPIGISRCGERDSAPILVELRSGPFSKNKCCHDRYVQTVTLELDRICDSWQAV
jgi:hypothetical protein